MWLYARGNCWFGHIRRCDAWINKAYIMEVVALSNVDKTWATTIKEDLIAWQVDTSNPAKW